MAQPEDQARENIDRMLTKSGWAVRDQGDAHISAYRGLAIRNFTLKQGHGFVGCQPERPEEISVS
jgi:type I restriction enzyme R subunit